MAWLCLAWRGLAWRTSGRAGPRCAETCGIASNSSNVERPASTHKRSIKGSRVAGSKPGVGVVRNFGRKSRLKGLRFRRALVFPACSFRGEANFEGPAPVWRSSVRPAREPPNRLGAPYRADLSDKFRALSAPFGPRSGWSKFGPAMRDPRIGMLPPNTPDHRGYDVCVKIFLPKAMNDNPCNQCG